MLKLLLIPLLALASLTGCNNASESAKDLDLAQIPAQAETLVLGQSTGEADDPAIWRDVDKSETSWILGTDKELGLSVYNLHGSQVSSRDTGKVNNVDVFRIDGFEQPIIGATHRGKLEKVNEPEDHLVFFRLMPGTGNLKPISGGQVGLELADPYGFTAVRYRGRTHVFVTGKSGALRQFVLSRNEQGFLQAEKVRSVDVGSVSEGLVADPEGGSLYVAEEREGIWRYRIDPSSGNQRVLFAEADGHRLVPDIEGLALAPEAGWLVASSQGSDHFAVFRLGDRSFVGGFQVAANPGKEIDAVTHTDGVALVEEPLPGYSQGLFVAHDDQNDGPGRAQNFKLVSWHKIKDALSQ